MDIEIKSSDRVFICGKCGSGKSYLGLHLLVPRLANVIVYDYKHEIELEGFEVFEDIRDFKKYPNRQRIIYRTRSGSNEEFDRLCKQAFYRGNTTLFLDELGFHTGSNNICRYHDLIMRLGRSKGIGCINVTQRPRGVSNNILSQCEHFFIFKQTMRKDLDKLEESHTRFITTETAWTNLFCADLLRGRREEKI